MLIGKSTVPLPVPTGGHALALAHAPSARRSLKSALSQGVGREAFSGQQRALSALSRTNTELRAREGLYQELRTRLSHLQTAAGSATLTRGVSQVSKPVFVSAIAGRSLTADAGATLSSQAASLGLASGGNGGFDLAVNGKAISVTGGQSIKDVVAAINGADAGVDASYDAEAGRVELRAREAGTEAIAIEDRSGTLAASLGLTAGTRTELLDATNAATGETRTVTTLTSQAKDALKAFTQGLDDVRSLLEGAVGPQGAYRDDTLLQDLSDALKGITTPSPDGRGKSLGDLGVFLKDGALQLDEGKLTSLAVERPNQLASAWGVFFGEGGHPLFKEGVQAIDDKQAQAPLEQRLAEQSVHVKAEMARMGDRQRTLLMQQAAFESQQNSLKRQEASLNQIHRKLVDELHHPGPKPIEVPPDVLKETLSLNLTPVAKPQLPEPGGSGLQVAGVQVPAEPPAPGLMAFGLGD